MESNEYYEFGAETLGAVGATVSWRRAAYNNSRKSNIAPMLVIQSCTAIEDKLLVPSESVTLSGKQALLQLRKAIDEALLYTDKE